MRPFNSAELSITRHDNNLLIQGRVAFRGLATGRVAQKNERCRTFLIHSYLTLRSVPEVNEIYNHERYKKSFSYARAATNHT